MISISTSSQLYPTNNFGHQNNVKFIHYSSYTSQGNNYYNYGLHQVQIMNNMTDRNLEIVGWVMKNGMVEEDFRTNIVKPGLFYTARLVPHSWSKYNSILGVLIVKIQGTNTFFSLGFQAPFHDYLQVGYKASMVQGNDPDRALLDLQERLAKEQPWGKHQFDQLNGRGRTRFTINDVGKP